MSDQDRLHDELIQGIDALERRIGGLVRPMNAARRSARPTDGWGVDMILEHLCLANGDYLAAMQRSLTAPGAPKGDGAWRPTLGGRLMAHSMRSTWRLPAPKTIVPGPAPRDDVLDAMLGTLAALRALLDDVRDREWRLLRFTSPYARWLPLNFGDAARIIVYHGERHARQIARVGSSLGD